MKLLSNFDKFKGAIFKYDNSLFAISVQKDANKRTFVANLTFHS